MRCDSQNSFRAARTVSALLIAAYVNCGPAAGADNSWPMYGMDERHTGFNPNEVTLSPQNVGGLHVLWAYKMGAISAEPIYAAEVNIRGVRKNVVYVGDSKNSFHALEAETGHLIWELNFPTQQSPCGNVGGIDSTATFDAASNTIYIGDGANVLRALDMSDGHEKWHTLVGNNTNTHIWGAIVQDQNSKTICVTKGAMCEENPENHYVGSVSSYSASDGANIGAFSTANPSDGYYKGGIWGVGGVAINQFDGRVYTATGNVASPPGGHETDWYGEHVLRLTPNGLSVIDGDAPFPNPPPSDLDIGSTPMLFGLNDSCTNLMIVEQKTGEILAYDDQNLGEGNIQRIQVGRLTGSGRFIGVTAYSPATRMIYVTSPDDSFGPSKDTRMRAGLTAFNIIPPCQLSFAWNHATNFQTCPETDGPYTSPSIANGVVYYGDGLGMRLFAVDANTGVQLWESESGAIDAPVFGTPIVTAGKLFIGTHGSGKGTLYAFGPQ